MRRLFGCTVSVIYEDENGRVTVNSLIADSTAFWWNPQRPNQPTRAQGARLSVGAYLRRRALGQRVRSAVERRLGAAELRELNRIGVNLNQMARAMNSGAVSSPAETQEAVERVGELVAKLLAGERE